MKKGFLFVCLLNILFVLCLWPVFLGGLTFATQHHHMPMPQDKTDCATSCFVSSLQFIDTFKSQLNVLIDNVGSLTFILILALSLVVVKSQNLLSRRYFLSPPNFNFWQRRRLLSYRLNNFLIRAFSHGLINPKLYA